MLFKNTELEKSKIEQQSHSKKNKLSFMVTTQQFSKYVEQQFPECIYQKHNENYLFRFDKIEDIVHTGYFILFFNYILKTNDIYKQTFQRFLKNKCIYLNIPIIDLKNINETCDTYDRQVILILSIVYYFT